MTDKFESSSNADWSYIFLKTEKKKTWQKSGALN